MRRSDLRKKVLNFCGDNPEVVDTCEGLARWVGSEGEEIRAVLEVLVEEGVLLTKGTAERTVYFTNNRRTLKRKEARRARKQGKKLEG